MSQNIETEKSVDKEADITHLAADLLQSPYSAMPYRESLGAPPEGVLRVLLVENDPDTAQRSEAGLRSRLGGYLALTHVTSLALAIRSLMEDRFDAVILELDVHDASGIATLAGIRGAAPSVATIVYTNLVDDTLALRALRAGAHECFDKRETSPEMLARPLGFALERQRRITALEAARVEAAHRATHDPLTGLANRELFLDQLERALAFSARYARKTGLLFVDLDGFKSINDTRGHALGDTMLKAVAGRLLQSVRRSDAVARLGGDEFVVLLPDVTSRRDVAFVKDTILESLREAIDLGNGQQLFIEASIGSSMAPLDGSTAQELLDAADADMYREKYQRRRDRAVAPSSEAPGLAEDFELPSTTESVSHRREARLRAASTQGEFEVFYQPVLDVVADRIIGAEALLRWRDPDRGILLPSGFLGLAEDTGLIVPIGEQVLRDACEALVRWRAHGVGTDVRVAVNLSAVQLREHGFERRVAQILAETGCPPEALTLELTENSTVVDGEMAMETLRALKGLGVRLVVDDFGVGHASLTFLREAPVDGIKIDRRFVSQLLVDQRDQAIVASMVRLARGLGLDVVAEGVESGEQSQRLARLQCFAQQGRHFSEAVPYAAMTALLHERNQGQARTDVEWGPRRVDVRGA
ncbi:putative bifunctional diguanylate cyclase/phosphodiesterase [Gemmatimonas phototrophica]|uniref:putative bifunctional diguanylate cyclase/phosphodiesterase n=1 Tax=Gemmatimonas phototrophica TaxID=1379270 RepID=UPI0006A6D078|nr:GGDEF domain-containing response regulator [Gemmatimonas phototrophica]